jgi:hypothetical protein
MGKKTILALDMATKTGWSTAVASGVENFKKRAGESRGMLFIRFEAWLTEIVSITQPDLVVYERPHTRGRAANEVLNGLLAFVVKICEEHGINYTDCPSTTLKKHATGRGNASKSDMMDAYEAKWRRPPIDDNESDARWLHDWATNQYD